MKRRGFLRIGFGTLGAVVLRGADRLLGQQRDSAASDRLSDPEIVQHRAVATAADNDPVVKELEHLLKCTCG